MQTLELIQGTPEWHSHRLTHFNGSEAAAMLGLDANMSRDELLRLKVTGDEKEISPYVRDVIFGQGHRFEAACRPLIEAEIGEDLFPVIAIDDEDGRISVSLDGLTMAEDITWEHKQFNQALFDAVSRGELPEHHMPQVQQGLMVTKAEKCIFTVSDGTEQNKVSMEVLPDPAWFKGIRAGWAQFAADMEAWTPPAQVEKVTAAAIEELPALLVTVSGRVDSSNIVPFEKAMMAKIKSVNMNLQTDQDFADAEAMVKFLNAVEKDLEDAKKRALEQTADIASIFRTMDRLKETVRATRLDLNKLVTNEKTARRDEIAAEGLRAAREHVEAIEKELGLPIPAAVRNSFNGAGAMKGKKTAESLRSAVSQALANYKIAVNEVADRIRVNLKVLDEAGDYRFLFRDLGMICDKPADDFKRLVESRIAEHQEAEARRQREAEQREADRKAAEADKDVPVSPASRETTSSTLYQPESFDDPFEAWWATTGQIIGRSYSGQSEIEHRKDVAQAAWRAAQKEELQQAA